MLETKQAATKLYEKAICAGVNPVPFDQIEFNGLAEAALEMCSRCSVQMECLIVVNPHATFYDGIAAGKVFKNGIVQKRKGR